MTDPSLRPAACSAPGKLLAALLGVGGIAGLVLLYAYHPSELRFLPKCALHQLTGLNCPGCGSTRALHYLLHGEFSLALRMNALLVIALPLLIWSAARWFKFSLLKRIPEPIPGATWIGPAVAVFVITYFVLRNVPGMDWLVPH